MALEYKLDLRILGAYNLEFTDEDITLGTEIKETLDRSHDTISLEILTQPGSRLDFENEGYNIDISKEFQPYTPVTFLLFKATKELNPNTNEVQEKATDTLFKYMIIESDEVSEEYIGTEVRYTHKIILIDASKLLETELMPNMTFTQPIKNQDLGAVFDPRNESHFPLGEIKTYSNIQGWTGFATQIGIFGAAAGAGLILGITIASAAGTAIASGAASGALVGALAGPWGVVIGAAIGVVVGIIVGLVTRFSNIDRNLIYEFIQGTDCKPIIPTITDGLIYPNRTKIPKVKGYVDVNGYLAQVDAVFGEGGILEAVGQGLIPIYGITTIIKMIATWCGDTHPTFYIDPCAIFLINETTNKVYRYDVPVIKKSAESSEKMLGYTMGKIEYYCVEDYDLPFPENLDPGQYSLYYMFAINNIWYRDYEWWPFSTPFTAIPNGTVTFNTTDGGAVSASIVDFLNTSLTAGISGFVYDPDTVDAAAYRKNEYKIEPIYMSELLDRLENSIRCRDSISAVKYTYASNTIVDGYFDGSGLTTANSLTNKGWYTNTYRELNNSETSIVIEDELQDNNTYEAVQTGQQWSGSKTDLITTQRVVLYNREKEIITTISKQYTVSRSNNLYRISSVFDLPRNLSETAVYFRSSISIQKKAGNTDNQRLSNIILTSHIVKNDGYREPKYHFSENARALCNIICPEFTFSGKTLWEICLEIGELFHGIPTLQEGNIIDFRIVDDNKKKVIDFEKEGQITTANMTNYATRLYTPELKGLVQDNAEDEDNCQIIYPAPNSWIAPRNVNYEETVVKGENTGIVLEGPNTNIYKIKQVWVRLPVYQWGNKIGYEELNITPYVVEKNIWETLDNQVTIEFGDSYVTSERGMYLYYEQGKNIIYNVGTIPENVSVLGHKQTHLTIQFILKRLHNIYMSKNPLDTAIGSLGDHVYSPNDIMEYEFRVVYIPIHSRLNIARQSNLNDVYNQVTNNFNQTANVVSAQAFAKLTENTLERLGNAEITTGYTTRDLTDTINVGDCLVLHNRNYYVTQKLNIINNIDRTVTLKLSKDNYKQNDRIAVAREYRQYNIDSRNQVRKTLSKPYQILVSTEKLALDAHSTYVQSYSTRNTQLIAHSIKETLNPSNIPFKRLTTAFVSLMDKNNNGLLFNTIIKGKQPQRVFNKILPVVSDVLGNTMTFQWDMYDNFSAGRRLQTPNSRTLALLMDYLQEEEYYYENSTKTDRSIAIQDDARYCDDTGGTPRVYTSFFSVNENNPLPQALRDTFPDTALNKSTLTNYTENQLALDFIADKDSREALSFQVTVSAQTFDKDIDIYSLLRYNPLISDRKGISKPKWYGFTNDRQPDDSGYFSPNYSDLLESYVYGPYESSGSPYVYTNLVNRKKSYDGIVLINDTNAGAANEVLLIIRKPFVANTMMNVYFSFFEDELMPADFGIRTNLAPAPTRRLMKSRSSGTDLAEFQIIEEYIPSVRLENNKFYIDVEDITEHTGLNIEDLEAALVTKHTTRPRGIHKGFHGRKYSHKNIKEDLWATSNVYVGNPDKELNNKQDFLFNKIKIREDGELYYELDGEEHNIYDYLNQHMISNQDLKGSRLKHTSLQYTFRLKQGNRFSSFDKTQPITIEYNEDTKLPLYISL